MRSLKTFLRQLLPCLLFIVSLGFGSQALAQGDGSAGAPFNHATTGFEITPPHKSAACESCHNTPGLFKGTPRSCTTCHMTRPDALKPPVNHIPMRGADCSSCHDDRAGSTFQTTASVRFVQVHTTLPDCKACHDGQHAGAEGKPLNHVNTTSQCGSCHGQSSWLPATNQHLNVVPGSCGNCHNGVRAKGKNAAHIPVTTAACDNCHANFDSFAPAIMSHTGLTNCSSCHSGSYVAQKADAKPVTHIVTTEQCSVCHGSTQTWAGGTTFVHTASAIARCNTCHDGAHAPAPGQPALPNHVPTTAQCDVCHSGYTTFVGARVNHAMMSNQCSTCHNGSYTALNAKGRSGGHISIVGFANCDTCHNTSAWAPASNFAHQGVAVGQCSNCHGVTATGKPAGHIPVGSAACDDCHSNYRAFAPAQMNHTGYNGQCSNCHNGSYTSVNAQTKTATHVTTAEQCDTCHQSTTTWATATYVHATTDTNCSSCHNGARALGKSTNHIPTTAQCSDCHLNKVAFKPANMLHNSATAGLCSSCHSGSFRFANAQAKSAAHIPVGGGVECESCHQQNLTSFTPARMSHTSQTDCVSCHGGAFTSVNAQAKPVSHVATAAQCGTCHNTTNWTVVTYVHPAPAQTCTNCHSGNTRGALSKPTSHIPTAATCDTCHLNYVAFKPATMTHTGITSGCANCHNGSFTFANALAKPAGHIPTTADCVLCHKNGSVTWSGPLMDHTGTAGKCLSCHNGGYLMVNAQGKTATHISTNLQCDSAGCHSAAATSLSWALTSRAHQASDAGRCSTCHNGTVAIGKSVNHIPTAAQCDSCHTTFTAFRPATMNHAGLTSQCSTCHNGSYAFANALAKPANHIPTTAQCDTCHASGFNAWKPVTMNHTGLSGQCASCHGGTYLAQNAQNKPATHVPTTAQCDTCHTSTVTWATSVFDHGAVSPAATNRCSDCHSATAPVASKGLAKPANHIPTSAQCDTCHKNYTSFAPARMLTHAASAGQCATCHSGSFPAATGKPLLHIPTTQSCDVCHQYTAWKPASNFSHAGVSANCASCHDGVLARGKTMTHIPSAATVCSNCHATGTSFTPATMNHSNLTTTCSSCHNGAFQSVNAQGKPTWHVGYTPANRECNDSGCHAASTTSWATLTNVNHAAFSNPVAAGNCSTCHNPSATANRGLSKPTNHIPTTLQCDTCHNTTTFNPASMSHTSSAGLCSNCHNGNYLFANALAKTATHIQTTAQCDTCHRSTTTWTGAVFSHPADAAGRCATCHNGTTALGLNASTHISIAGAANCDSCHTGFTTFAPARMNHAGLTTACVTCHSGTFVSINAQAPSAAHIPIGALSCANCHSNGFAAWSPAVMNHTGVGACTSCHSGSYVSQNAQTKPSWHVSYTPAGKECNDSGCHTTSTTTWWVGGGNIDHGAFTNPVAAGNCATCHSPTATVNRGLAKSTTHLPTTAQCDTCHTGYAAFTPARMNHTSTAGLCLNCHNGSYTAVNARAKTATHISTTQVCDTCHTTIAWKPASNFAHQGVTTGTCATCHNGTNALGKTTTHIPVTLACDNCHKNYVAFAPAQMNHTGLAGQCSTCHGGAFVSVNAQTKTTTHVPTSAQCDTCHSSTTTWATATYTHAAGDINCSSCHNGSNALGKPTNHVPTTAQCSSCHANRIAFKPAQMSHIAADVVVANKCSTCHNGNYVFANALAKPATHIPVTVECDTCHTRGYTAWAPAVMNHTGAGLTTNCSSCHSGAYVAQNAQMKPASHTVTALQCNSAGCHTTTTYSSWAIATRVHQPADANNCTSCHNGSGNNALSKPTNHVPTSAQCDTCHNTTTFVLTPPMNHLGTTGLCAGCHNGAYTFTGAQAKTSNHIPTALSCDNCHSTTAWKPTNYAHTGVAAGTCATCHNGVNALGKSTQHIPVVFSCDNCHKNYVAFTPAQMNHTGLSSQCSTCHSGSYLAVNAQKKPTTHVATTAQCDTCHNSTTTWATGVYTHQPADTVCSSCHNGTNALGKPANHVPTSGQCSSCHTNKIAFNPAQMSHIAADVPVAGKCTTCHNGNYVFANALAKPVGHIPVTVECDTCHTRSFTAWAPAVMNHTGAGLTTNCSTCHSGAYLAQNAQMKPANHTQTALQCNSAGCHTTSSYSSWAIATRVHQPADANHCTDCHNGSGNNTLYKPGNHVPTLAPAMAQCDACHNTTSFVLSGPMNHANTATYCAGCHNGSYTFTGAQAKSANHIVTTQSCENCHTTTAWRPTSFAHTVAQVAGKVCSACHNGTNASGKPVLHVPTSAACSDCHRNTAWVPLITPYAHTGVTAASCTTCHGGSYPGVSVKPSNHIPTTATTASCDGCHLRTAWMPLTAFAHTGVGVGTCDSCHTSPYTNIRLKPNNHIPVTGIGLPALKCDGCHVGTTVFTISRWRHTNAGTTLQCTSCHLPGQSWSVATEKKSLNHESSGKTDCDASGCHKPGTSGRGTLYSSW